MNQLHSPGHSVTIEINKSWEETYDYIREPLNLGKWALGCWDTRATDEEDLYVGTSLFNNETSYFRIEADKKTRVIDFLVGDQSSLQPRISVRIVPGEVYGNSDAFCLVTINAWRDMQMSDERWHQLCVCHETEILLVKALIEREE
jgi:hypothetical protein